MVSYNLFQIVITNSRQSKQTKMHIIYSNNSKILKSIAGITVISYLWNMEQDNENIVKRSIENVDKNSISR